MSGVHSDLFFLILDECLTIILPLVIVRGEPAPSMGDSSSTVSAVSGCSALVSGCSLVKSVGVLIGVI